MGYSRVVVFCFYFALIHAVIPTAAQYCYTSGNYTSNSTYRANLDSLLTSMSSNTNINYGFYNFSAGEFPNKVNAIALCRGDISPNDCRSCINKSSHDLLWSCPNQKEAIIWAETCSVRYSYKSIFGIVDVNPLIASSNVQNFSDVEGFNKVLRPLLDSLRKRASLGNSSQKFAVQSVPAPDFQTIHALVECTPDLSKVDCTNCLEQVQGYIPKCCDGKQGGKYVTPSCYIRYEIYGFYDPSAEAPLPPPPVLPPTTRGMAPLTFHALQVGISSWFIHLFAGFPAKPSRTPFQRQEYKNSNLL